jgi:hypothetical protein
MAESFRDFEHRGWEDPRVCAQYDGYFARLTTQALLPCSMRCGLGHRTAYLTSRQGRGPSPVQRPHAGRETLDVGRHNDVLGSVGIGGYT